MFFFRQKVGHTGLVWGNGQKISTMMMLGCLPTSKIGDRGLKEVCYLHIDLFPINIDLFSIDARSRYNMGLGKRLSENENVERRSPPER